MKSTLTLLLVISVSFSLSAQTTKGSFMIGGSGSISFDNSDTDGSYDSRSTSVSLSPEVGYFFIKNFSVGLSLPLSMSWSKTKITSIPEESDGRGHSIGVAPFVRYYIPVKSFFIVTEGSFGWQYVKSTYESRDPATGTIIGSNEYTDKYKGYSVGAGPAFFLNPYTSIEILAKYQHSDREAYDQSSFYISVGFQIYLPSNRE